MQDPLPRAVRRKRMLLGGGAIVGAVLLSMVLVSLGARWLIPWLPICSVFCILALLWMATCPNVEFNEKSLQMAAGATKNAHGLYHALSDLWIVVLRQHRDFQESHHPPSQYS